MENSDRIELTREYVKKLNTIKYWALQAAGFGRFSIENDRIVGKSLNSVFYSAFVLITAIVTVISIIYETSVLTHYLMYGELVIFLELSFIINSILLNITFGNRHNLAKLIEHSIEIDILLGVKETKFMRDIADTAYTIMGVPVVVVQLSVVTLMYFTFDVSILVHVTGSSYFLWAFFCFFDVNYLLTHYSFLNLRTRYVNVALMKTLNVKVEYIPDLFLFNGVFWKSKHDDLVKFHENADVMKYVVAYKKLFNHLKIFLKCYQFTVSNFFLILLNSTLITFISH